MSCRRSSSDRTHPGPRACGDRAAPVSRAPAGPAPASPAGTEGSCIGLGRRRKRRPAARSIKTAHPQSLPPGVSGSGGINRSTKASTAAPSSGVKNTHGPGLTACGGSPANGRHGNPLPPANVRALAPRATSSIAVEASNARRLGSQADGLVSASAGSHDVVLASAESVSMAFPSQEFQSRYWSTISDRH